MIKLTQKRIENQKRAQWKRYRHQWESNLPLISYESYKYIHRYLPIAPHYTVLRVGYKDPVNLIEELHNVDREYYGEFFKRENLLPKIGWIVNKKEDKTTKTPIIGGYIAKHNLILISLAFNTIRLPRKYIKEIIFHELLHHLYYIVFPKSGLAFTHPPDFMAIHHKAFPGPKPNHKRFSRIVKRSRVKKKKDHNRYILDNLTVLP